MTITAGTDSFTSVADADSYMANRANADAWPIHVPVEEGEDPETGDPVFTAENPATLALKEKLLKTATQILNRESYVGRIATTSQALAWPRAGIIDPEGRVVASTTIPDQIKHATAELALFLIKHDLSDEVTRRWMLRLRSEGVGSSQASYDARLPDNLPAVVRSLIRPYTHGGGNSVALIA